MIMILKKKNKEIYAAASRLKKREENLKTSE